MPESTLIPIDPSSQNPDLMPKRKRGGQPGNRNALKHGLFIEGNYLYNLNPVEKAQLHDNRDLIEYFKKSMVHLYEVSINSNDLVEINSAMRTMSSAAMALTRLLNSQEEHSEFLLHRHYRPSTNKPPTRHSFIRGLMKNVKNFVDLSELEMRLDEDDLHYKEELESTQFPENPISGESAG